MNKSCYNCSRFTQASCVDTRIYGKMYEGTGICENKDEEVSENSVCDKWTNETFKCIWDLKCWENKIHYESLNLWIYNFEISENLSLQIYAFDKEITISSKAVMLSNNGGNIKTAVAGDVYDCLQCAKEVEKNGICDL